MADNYIEKKFEEFYAKGRTSKAPTRKATPSLDSLLLKNRSYRGFCADVCPGRAQLQTIVSVADKLPSARNQQVLRYRLVCDAEADSVLPLIRLGGALPELHLPLPGTEPRAYIVICSTVEPDHWVWTDLGIAAQSLLLKAVSLGLHGICIGAFNKEKLTEILQLPHRPLLVLALGRGTETIQLTHIKEGESQKYYRKDGLHLVPKIPWQDLIL